jgi:hydrogenase expression/formation protein HypE
MSSTRLIAAAPGIFVLRPCQSFCSLVLATKGGYEMASRNNLSFSCPLPIRNHERILLAHGGGGSLMRQLIDEIFIKTFSPQTVKDCHDAAARVFGSERLAFTSDAYVVSPLIFPGGDIGILAVNGTVNDLAMAGARPLYLSASFILEEGLSMQTLRQITQSMKEAADQAEVEIITGDTKVVDKGKGDGLFIVTSGIGVIPSGITINPQQIKPGCDIILSGDLGQHGMAIMAVREGLQFESSIESDTAPLAKVVEKLLNAKIRIRCLRDLTRGGLSSALNELATASECSFHIDESAIPIREDVASACEMLGLDPLYVANEGRFVAIVDSLDTKRCLDVMRGFEIGKLAQRIGRVESESKGLVSLQSKIGAKRVLDMLSGEQLPRIC